MLAGLGGDRIAREWSLWREGEPRREDDRLHEVRLCDDRFRPWTTLAVVPLEIAFHTVEGELKRRGVEL